jgi:putative transposase
MRGFPHSNDPEGTVKEELWVGVTPSGWSPVVWIPMKGILRAVKPREEGSIPNNIKPNETRTPVLPLLPRTSSTPSQL